jgi:hypothetical protein
MTASNWFKGKTQGFDNMGLALKNGLVLNA